MLESFQYDLLGCRIHDSLTTIIDFVQRGGCMVPWRRIRGLQGRTWHEFEAYMI